MEKELEEIKEKTKYKVNGSTLTDDKSKKSSFGVCWERSLCMEPSVNAESINEESTKVKVLSLTKKNL